MVTKVPQRVMIKITTAHSVHSLKNAFGWIEGIAVKEINSSELDSSFSDHCLKEKEK